MAKDEHSLRVRREGDRVIIDCDETGAALIVSGLLFAGRLPGAELFSRIASTISKALPSPTDTSKGE